MPVSNGRLSVCLSILVLLALMWSLPAAAATRPQGILDSDCRHTELLAFGQTYRLPPRPDEAEGRWLRVDLPEPGWLRLEQSAQDGRPLGFLPSSQGCGGQRPPEFRVNRRSTDSITMTVSEAGSLFFHTPFSWSGNPGRLRIRASFVADPALRGGEGEADGSLQRIDPPVRGGEDEEEIEVDGSPQAIDLPVRLRKDQEKTEVDRTSILLAGRVAEICNVDADDHGDALECATPLPLGSIVDGEIKNGWGDDQDAFEMRLGSPDDQKIWQLSFQVAADFDVDVRIYGHDGVRLAAERELGRSEDLGISAVLPSGRYYLRIQGRDAATGAFALHASALPR